MKTVVLVRDGELAGYPADILVDGEVRKSYNLEFECEKAGAKMVIAKSMPSSLIKKLRDKDIIFLKLNSIEEIEELDLNVTFPEEFSNKRGWKCGKKGF